MALWQAQLSLWDFTDRAPRCWPRRHDSRLSILQVVGMELMMMNCKILSILLLSAAFSDLQLIP